MRDKTITFLMFIGAILATGFILDELGNQGRLGDVGKAIAKKITAGYGA